MVLLEALACETPVVSFDCPTGPSEIIINNKNGLLIEDQNFQKLQEALDRLVTDRRLLESFTNNAKASVKRFSLETIGRQWMDYLNSMID